MFDIGLQELVVIFVIALIVFGPKNLPQLGRSMGRAMREFRRASDEFRSTIEANLQIHEIDPPPVSPSPEPIPAEPAPAGSGDGGALPDSVLYPYGGESAAMEPAAAAGEPYLGQRGAKLFHGRDCGWAKRIPEADRVYFKRVADAKETGVAACPVCEPWEPA
jgi:sec-independent protein translocase protein TatA